MSWGSGHTIPHTGTLFSPLKIKVGRMTISETPHTVRLMILATRGFRHFVDLIGWTTARYRSMLITIRQKILVNWLRESGREVEEQGWRTILWTVYTAGEQAEKHMLHKYHLIQFLMLQMFANQHRFENSPKFILSAFDHCVNKCFNVVGWVESLIMNSHYWNI